MQPPRQPDSPSPHPTSRHQSHHSFSSIFKRYLFRGKPRENQHHMQWATATDGGGGRLRHWYIGPRARWRSVSPPPLLATVMSVSVSASVVVIVGSLPPQPPPIRDGSATAIATTPASRSSRANPSPYVAEATRKAVPPSSGRPRRKKKLKNIKSERLRGDSGGVLRQWRGRMMRRRRLGRRRAAAA